MVSVRKRMWAVFRSYRAENTSEKSKASLRGTRETVPLSSQLFEALVIPQTVPNPIISTFGDVVFIDHWPAASSAIASGYSDSATSVLYQSWLSVFASAEWSKGRTNLETLSGELSVGRLSASCLSSSRRREALFVVCKLKAGMLCCMT